MEGEMPSWSIVAIGTPLDRIIIGPWASLVPKPVFRYCKGMERKGLDRAGRGMGRQCQA